jgi:hypothetical protein
MMSGSYNRGPSLLQGRRSRGCLESLKATNPWLGPLNISQLSTGRQEEIKAFHRQFKVSILLSPLAAHHNHPV